MFAESPAARSAWRGGCPLGAALAIVVASVLAAAMAAAAGPSNGTGEGEGTPARAPVLAPGEYVWLPEAAPAGPLLLVVSLDEQRAHLYRNGVRIAVTTVSTGKTGKETPTGVYTILQKRIEHYSNLYDDAPMPYMQRLTWTGIALHAGRLPGYPASHGCVRLPDEFARRLFEVTALGMTVVVADGATAAPALVHPGWLAPAVRTGDTSAAMDAPEGTGHTGAEPSNGEEFWAPERSPEGPVTIVLGLHDRSLRVLRGGVEIGRSPIRLAGPAPPGVRVLQLMAGTEPGENAYVPDRPRLAWRQVSFDAAADPAALPLAGRLTVPRQFARNVHDVLRPGATVVITDQPLEAAFDGEPLLEGEPGGVEAGTGGFPVH